MIYFIQVVANGPIKIGTTECMGFRMAQHATSLGKPVGVLGIIEGGMSVERAIHRQFEHLRIGKARTEWFEPTAELMAFIDEATSPWDGESLNELTTLASLKGSDEMEAWLNGLVDTTGMGTRTLLLKRSLREFAATVKYAEPMPKR